MDAVAEALTALAREHFLPDAERGQAAYDGPLPIGHGQTNSQPRTVADMLRLLDVRPGQRVLDVGSGSGWTTALLGRLVGPTGTVIGVERVPELVAFGAANLVSTDQPWTRIEQALDGTFGWPEEAPYDRILVSAEATVLPRSLVEQLVADQESPGRLVIPVAGEMVLVERTGSAERVTRHGRYRFVPLL
ncbi:protein-L-isoaspartate O-methyltransferase [Nocardioides sp.]|uniref:protein-L-isoaspartate O-methyltransferase family protein n=1 Tax=Nocardioides sp. TaxID=35761 RepID=UPI0035291CEB